MKIELLKSHNGKKKGEVIEVSAERANYLQRVGAAKEFKVKAKVKQPKKKK